MAILPSRAEVFIAYAPIDRSWRDRLCRYLEPLERENLLRVWDDTHAQPGSLKSDELQRALERARVAVLLVSQDLLARDSTALSVVLPLTEAAIRGELSLLWVLIRPALHENSPLHVFTPVGDPDMPLSLLSPAKQEAALATLAREIRTAVASPPRASRPATVPPLAESRTGIQSLSIRYMMVFPERPNERREAERLHDALAREGFYGRLVGDVELGEYINQAMESALGESDVVIMCGVRGREGSDEQDFTSYDLVYHTTMELLKRQGRKVFPVHLTGDHLPLLLSSIKETSWVRDPVGAVQEIIKAARRLEQSKRPPPR